MSASARIEAKSPMKASIAVARVILARRPGNRVHYSLRRFFVPMPKQKGPGVDFLRSSMIVRKPRLARFDRKSRLIGQCEENSVGWSRYDFLRLPLIGRYCTRWTAWGYADIVINNPWGSVRILNFERNRALSAMA